MSPDPLRNRPPEPEQTDDIEILEVVGLDEDGVPLVDEEGEDAAEDGDVEVVFEDDRPGAPEWETPPRGAPREESELKERLLRLQADFENFKKRMDRERMDFLRHATGDLVARLLPVLDNFDRALAAAGARESADPLVEGVALIQRQLQQELGGEGLRPMEATGLPFDPEVHEAVATDDRTAAPPNTVTAVLQRGYFFHDRVLRPALVRVSVGGDDPAPGAREES